MINEKIEEKIEKLREKLNKSIENQEDYDVIYYTGGHGVMWDFPNNSKMQEVSRKIYENGGIVSAVCHGVVALLNIEIANGKNLIDGVKVTGFSNSEEEALGLDKVVPFLAETELINRGSKYAKGSDWVEFAVSDKRVVTGQNPASDL